MYINTVHVCHIWEDVPTSLCYYVQLMDSIANNRNNDSIVLAVMIHAIGVWVLPLSSTSISVGLA